MPDFRRLSWIILVVVVGLAGCGGPGDHPRFPDDTPIIIISVDTLRSDHLPAYGYREVETPAIDALRRDGILYEHAYTSVPLTLPAHTSLLSGRLPPGHGVRDNLGYTVDPESSPMLQTVLRDEGYVTGAAVSAYVMRRDTGIGSGFDTYEDIVDSAGGGDLLQVQRSGRETMESIRPWIRDVADRPFFLLFHLFEPHTPYEPPEPYASRYASPYDGEIAAADAVVADLVGELERLDVYDRACVVFLSDHGEGLGEHGEDQHGLFLYRTTLQIPLILKLPRQDRAGGTVERPVQIVDVFPTILSALGSEPPPGLPGGSLLGDEPNDRPLFAETLYPRLHFGWSELASVVSGRWQLIDAPAPELYDLRADPDQQANLAERRPDVVTTLRRDLGTFERAFEAPVQADPRDRRRLESLGYLGGSSSAGAGPLPDPKSRVGVLAELDTSRRAMESGDPETAIQVLRTVLEDNPRIEDAWDMLARAHLRLGHTDEAIATYQRGLRSIPKAGLLALRAAMLMYEEHRVDEAQRHAELAASYDPAAAHTLLALIEHGRGDSPEAERHARRAVASNPSRTKAWITLAEIVAQDGRTDEAVAELERALATAVTSETGRLSILAALLRIGAEDSARRVADSLAQSRDPETLVALGEIAAGQNRLDDARSHFERALRLRPDHAAALVDLATLDLTAGRHAEARRRLERAVDLDPSSAQGWNVLGAARAEAGDTDGAIRAWEQALAADPTLSRVLYNLAMVNARAERFEPAVKYMERFSETVDGGQREQALGLLRQLRSELRRAGG